MDNLDQQHEVCLVEELLSEKGITFKRASRFYGLSTPWDVFDFCRKHGIWLQVKAHWDAHKTRYYHGVKLKTVTQRIVE